MNRQGEGARNVRSFASVVAFGTIWVLFDWLSTASDLPVLDYHWVYLIGGVAVVCVVAEGGLFFPRFPQKVAQYKNMVMRTRYCLYSALTFMSSARRQIFVVFAGFLMVDKFDYDVENFALLFLIKAMIIVWLALRIGHLGDRDRPVCR